MTYARNVGVRSARGRFLVFTDADDLAAARLADGAATALGEPASPPRRLELERAEPRRGAGTSRPPALIERAYGPPSALRLRNDDRDPAATCTTGSAAGTRRSGLRATWALLPRPARHRRAARLAPDAVVHYRHRAGLRQRSSRSISVRRRRDRRPGPPPGEWRDPLTVLSWPHLILRNGRRLLKPDARGGRWLRSPIAASSGVALGPRHRHRPAARTRRKPSWPR